MSDLAFDTVPVPDERPPLQGVDYDPEFPGSTPEAPYGFKEDGTPYKRRPKGGKRSTAGKRMPASDATARAAAGLLARLNTLVAVGLSTALRLPETGAAILEANERFEVMAFEALQTDPALCKKILGAGATSGKAGLVMAYSMLGVAVIPTALPEVRSRRELAEGETDVS